MPTHVYANCNEVASKAADGKSIAAFPDVCFSPPAPPVGPMPLPYPNTGEVKDTDQGTAKVFVKDKMSGMAGDSYMTKSMGDEAATQNFNKGFITGALQGKCYFGLWSMDVNMEGKGVPRHLDLVTHNHASMTGNGVGVDTDGSDQSEISSLVSEDIENLFFISIVAISETGKIARYDFEKKISVNGNSVSIEITYSNLYSSVDTINISLSDISFSKKICKINRAQYSFSGNEEDHKHIVNYKHNLYAYFNAKEMILCFPVINTTPAIRKAPCVKTSIETKTRLSDGRIESSSSLKVSAEYPQNKPYTIDICKEKSLTDDDFGILPTDNDLVKKIKKLGVQNILAKYDDFNYNKNRTINLFAIRKKSKIATNCFVDAIGFIYKDGEKDCMRIFNATTIASTKLFKFPSPVAKRPGTPILSTGQHIYKFGRHHGKVRAFVQESTLMTYRDTTSIDNDKPDVIIDLMNPKMEPGNSLNIHTTTYSDSNLNAFRDETSQKAMQTAFNNNAYITGRTDDMNKAPHSAGCQVIQMPQDYVVMFDAVSKEMISRCPRRANPINPENSMFSICVGCNCTNAEGHRPCFIYYTMFNEEDFFSERRICAHQRLENFQE